MDIWFYKGHRIILFGIYPQRSELQCQSLPVELTWDELNCNLSRSKRVKLDHWVKRIRIYIAQHVLFVCFIRIERVGRSKSSRTNSVESSIELIMNFAQYSSCLVKFNVRPGLERLKTSRHKEFTFEKEQGLHHNKLSSNLASGQRPDH